MKSKREREKKKAKTLLHNSIYIYSIFLSNPNLISHMAAHVSSAFLLTLTHP